MGVQKAHEGRAPGLEAPSATWQQYAITAASPADEEINLGELAKRYLHQEVFLLQSQATFVAKAHDLGNFVGWLGRVNRCTSWSKQDTLTFLKDLEEQGCKVSTINKALATLRGFAAWIFAQPGNMIFAEGLPTAGIKGASVDMSVGRKLCDIDVRRLLRAAMTLTLTRTNKAQRPWRDRAILMLLLYTSLRTSELIKLTLGQYTGKSFVSVCRNNCADKVVVHIPPPCCDAIEDYLTFERGRHKAAFTADSLLFLATGHRLGQRLSCGQVSRVLRVIAREVRKNHPDAPASIRPCQLRGMTPSLAM